MIIHCSRINSPLIDSRLGVPPKISSMKPLSLPSSFLMGWARSHTLARIMPPFHKPLFIMEAINLKFAATDM